MTYASKKTEEEGRVNEELIKELEDKSVLIAGMDDLDTLIEKIKDKKVVMLGEASHGTKEFYEWRMAISMELIRRYDFNFIAVEGDWPPCQAVNSYVRGESSQNMMQTLREFSRWPTWMWANTTVLDLLDELRAWNEEGNTIGFHGLDVYSLFESMDVVLENLKILDPDLALKTSELYSCLEPYRHDERSYLRALVHHPEGCKTYVLKALQELLDTRLRDGESIFDTNQNAKVVKNAERYYRAMISLEDSSWNVRDEHMMDTLNSLLSYYGPDSKGIVWAHNTHIGDYRGTDMIIRGEVNIGGLAREQLGKEKVSLVGFSTFAGEVIAGKEWDAPMEKMTVPPSPAGTLECALHEVCRNFAAENLLLSFEGIPTESPLYNVIGHRAIGVVYRPEYERLGQYVPTRPAHRYDHLIFINRTSALSPLPLHVNEEKMPETWPYGDHI